MTQIESDCSILLERALFGRLVCAFGEDGFGQHGRNDTPVFYLIKRLIVLVESHSSPTLTGKVWLFLDSYDSADHGLIQTDKNFEISLRKLLDEQKIDSKALSWGALADQGSDFVVMNIDVHKLLS